MATRGQQIINALAQRDKDIIQDLSIPVYDTTKGLTAKERQKAVELAGTFLPREHIGEVPSSNCVGNDSNNSTAECKSNFEMSPANRIEVFEEAATSSSNYQEAIPEKKPNGHVFTSVEPTSTPVSRGRNPRRKRRLLFQIFDKNEESDDSDTSIKPLFDDDSDADGHWYPETDDDSDDSDGEKRRKKPKQKSTEQKVSTSNPHIEPVEIQSLTEKNSSPELEEVVPPESHKKTKRDWSKRACCLYCGKCFTKLPRHWERKHKNELDVAQMLAHPLGSQRRFDMIQELKNKGNFLHNSEVVKTGKGALIPKKVPAKEENSETNAFVPCIYCRAFFKKGSLSTHIKNCSVKIKTGQSSSKNRNMQSQAALLLPSPLYINDRFKRDVFAKMKVDAVYREIRGDSLILSYGSQLYDKHGDENHLHGFVAQKMREIGRFLVTLKEMDSSVSSLEDCFLPRRVSDVIAGLNKVAGFDNETRTYKTPSLVLKLAGSLRKCGQIAVGNALRLANECQQTVLENFIRLFSQEVKLLTFRSLKTLKRRKWNKPSLIPLANDVRQLNDYLKKEGVELVKTVNDIPTKELLTKLAENTLAKITCFNRKRVGEVERMPLQESGNIKIGQLTSDVLETLSDTEKQIVRCLGRVEVRGKTGRKVAIIITKEIKQQIDILCRPMSRRIMGIDDSSVYLFATRADPRKPMRGCDVLRKYAYKCGAERPENITSTKLRKHLATMSQIMNLNKNELDILANFMGHDIRVHRQFYRLPEDVLQIAKVSKVLLNLEKGRSDLLVDNNLDSVNVEEKETVMDEDSEDEDNEFAEDEEPPEDISFETSHHGNPSTSSSKLYIDTQQAVPTPFTTASTSKNDHNRTSSTESQVYQPSTSTTTHQTSRPTKKNKGKRTPWTEEENKAVIKYFDNFITLRSLPGKTECEQAQLAYPVLQNRPWSQIKFKIKNILTKLNGE